MITLGVCPGLEALHYVACQWRGELAEVVDYDVLHVRGQGPDSSHGELLKRARAHQLVLGVVFERGPAVCVGVGPPAKKREPEAHVEVARRMIEDLARTFRVPLLSCPERDDVYEVLAEASEFEEAVTPRSLRPVVEGFLRRPLPSTGREAVVSAACAICAWHVQRAYGGA